MKFIKAEDDETPLCPHCEKPLQDVKAKPIKGGFIELRDRWMYFCPGCRKVLGVGHALAV